MAVNKQVTRVKWLLKKKLYYRNSFKTVQRLEELTEQPMKHYGH